MESRTIRKIKTMSADHETSGKPQTRYLKENETATNGAQGCPHTGEIPLGRALFRMSRAIFFEGKSIPELDMLPLAQLRLLWTVRIYPDATMKDFSERLRVSQSTVTQLAERLVRRGLVERLADPNDRRVVRLRVTEIGQQHLGQADNERKRVLKAVWDALSVQDRGLVMQGLEVLAQTAEAIREAEGRPLPPLPENFALNSKSASDTEAAREQPVVDLMARRIRGR
jgi:DNA-binding MarR family transcriptional regulator